ncbi:MAG: gamma-glutamylcyclotransferase [Xanthomonadales bacterium]|nr:gamma-glutamylcyclotransferase [Xanthomonadales bacterium]
MSHDTREINRSSDPFADTTRRWLFGYGSLIWKADFAYAARRPARLHGWERRFWQGSHDHRGTPQAPGRVLTLVEAPGARCLGMAYSIGADVLEALDLREKNGYLRVIASLEFDDGERAQGLVYIATADNAAWLGPAADEVIARHVAGAAGPSGSNRDYVLHLADALRGLGAEDAHVFAVERRLRALQPEATTQ